MLYQFLFKPILFLFDAETAHNFSFRMLKLLLAIPGARSLLKNSFAVSRPDLVKEVFGLKFPNPVGLAAGFDKDAKLGSNWKYFGFGFIELGTVTPKPQAGNDRPRLFRLPKDEGIINRMGFNNGGVENMLERLKKLDRNDVVVGVNIGKNKVTPNEKAVDDYIYCFEALFDYVDYFVVNVSSPNTPGLRSLQEKEPLTQLLNALQEKNQDKPSPKPILLKIAPDLNEDQLKEVVEVVLDTKLDGIIATNTTIQRDGLVTNAQKVKEIGAGGLSGKPLTDRSLEVLRSIQGYTQGKIPIISVGGIMSPMDAQARLDAGASLVQVYSGFVYGGPSFVKKIVKFLTVPKIEKAVS